MPEYLVQDDGSLRQIRPYPSRKHAGSILERSEWEAAIDKSKAELLSKPSQATGSVDLQPTHVLQHLARMAQVDKAYAWWSAHLYAEIHPELAGMPDKLAEHMNQAKEAT